MTWKYITEYDEVIQSIPEIVKYPAISLDIETRGLNVFTDAVVLIQIGTPQIVYIYDARFLDLTPLFNALREYTGIMCFHNAKFDCESLRYYYGFLPNRIFDTMIAEVLLTIGIGTLYPSLNYLSTHYLNRPLAKEIRESFAEFTAFFSDEQLNYAADDAISTLALYPILNERLSDLGLQAVAELEFELVKAISDMELTGIAFCQDTWKNCHTKSLEDYKQAEADFYQMIMPLGSIMVGYKHKGVVGVREIPIANVNLNSPAQLTEVIHKLGFKVPNTRFETLSLIDDPIVQQLVKYRKFAKRISTYGENFYEYINPLTKRVHTTFNQIGAETGRESSDSPNMQNIPNPKKDKDAPDYRAAFVASPGYDMVVADYSQIELRILAEVSQEPKFLKAYAEGADLHTLTASLVYHVVAEEVTPYQRTTSKNINFATAYGSGAANLSRKFKIPFSEAESLINNFHKGYPVLSTFLYRSGQDAVINHYSKTLLGRRRNFQIPSINDPNFKSKISAIKREGTNHIIQGTSADMTKIAKVDLYHAVGQLEGRLLLAVHDEIVCEFPQKFSADGAKLVEEIMVKAGERLITSVPVLVEANVCPYWSK